MREATNTVVWPHNARKSHDRSEASEWQSGARLMGKRGGSARARQQGYAQTC
jgi:hypothetical protein